MPPAAVTLTPVAEQEFPMLHDLADAIWRQHYGEIISTAQIDYMLAGRMSDESLRNYVQTPDRWLEVLRAAGTPVGYCASEVAAMPGDGSDPATMKLGQLYVLASYRGMGLGRLMLGHVEGRASDLGKTVLWLQVNKKNTGAIGFYKAAGFEVVREAVFDIGSGFVMDDYVMAKRLGAE